MKWHPLAETYPLLKDTDPEAWDRFKKSIQKSKGPRKPCLYRVVNGEQQALDGRNRYLACQELKIKCPWKRVSVKDEDVERFIEDENDQRRHMDAAARRERVRRLRERGLSVRQIGDQLGVSPGTVSNDLAGVQNCTPGTVTGKDGKTYPATKPPQAEREPGDDTDTETEAARNGKGRYDWKTLDKALGVVARAPDEIGRAYSVEKNSEEYHQSQRLLDQLVKVLRDWQRRLTRSKR